MLAAPRQRLGAHAAPGDRRLEVVAGERFALVAERLGLGGAALREQRAAEQRRGLRRVDAEAVVAQPVVGAAQAALGGDGVAFEQLDEAGEDVGLEQPLRDAELLDHVPRRRDHAPRRVGAAAQRLEHGLAAQRDGLDRRRALRDAQHAHDVEAAAAGARRPGSVPRARRAARRRAPRWRGAGRRARRAAASARSSAASQAPILPRRASASACTECAFASPAASPAAASVVGRGRDRVGGGAQRLRIGEHRELAGEAGVPGAQASREPAE